jgi:hypothetical protein
LVGFCSSIANQTWKYKQKFILIRFSITFIEERPDGPCFFMKATHKSEYIWGYQFCKAAQKRKKKRVQVGKTTPSKHTARKQDKRPHRVSITIQTPTQPMPLLGPVIRCERGGRGGLVGGVCVVLIACGSQEGSRFGIGIDNQD